MSFQFNFAKGNSGENDKLETEHFEFHNRNSYRIYREDGGSTVFLNIHMLFYSPKGFEQLGVDVTISNLKRIDPYLIVIPIDDNLDTSIEEFKNSIPPPFDSVIVKQIFVFSHGIMKDEFQKIPYIMTQSTTKYDHVFSITNEEKTQSVDTYYVDFLEKIWWIKCPQIFYDCCARIADTAAAFLYPTREICGQGNFIVAPKKGTLQIINEAYYLQVHQTVYCLSQNQVALIKGMTGSFLSYLAMQGYSHEQVNCPWVDPITLQQNFKRFTSMTLKCYNISRN